MPDRNVGRLPRLDAERHAHGLAFHESARCGLNGERQSRRRARPRKQSFEVVPTKNNCRLQRRCGLGFRHPPAEFLKPGFELVALEILAQGVFVRRARCQFGNTHADVHVAPDRCQLPGHRQHRHAGAQVVANLALDLVGVSDHFV